MSPLELIKNAAITSGFKIYDENEYMYVLGYQLETGQYEFIDINGKVIGFFGWLTKPSLEGICVCINNMFVMKEYKNEFNIFDMCKFFKIKYPNIYKLEWHNHKKDIFKQLILKGRNI